MKSPNYRLQEILETKTFINSNNESVKIHSETSWDQCCFIQKIIEENGFKNSLEIGLAYGISSVAILDKISKNQGKHIAIDKFQTDHWGNNGIELIKNLNLIEWLTFYEEYSYKTLPKLLSNGVEVDFAYIDSTKLFDWLLVDFFYIDKMLRRNGIIVFDDVNFPSIRKLLRFTAQLPNYEVYATYPNNRNYSKSKALKIQLLKNLPIAELFLKNEILKTDFELGINSGCVALIKKNEDHRKYDWHSLF